MAANIPGHSMAFGLWPKSKAISIIFVSIFISGGIAGIIKYKATITIDNTLVQHTQDDQSSLPLMLGSRAIVILSLLLYPVFGFLADACCGRYWTVAVSLSLMAIGTFISSFTISLNKADQYKTLMAILTLTSSTIITAGVAGFEANAVQLGLDQLMEYSSTHLSLYLHWLVWFRYMGDFLCVFPLTLTNCYDNKTDDDLQFLPLIIFVFLVLSIIITLRMKNAFYIELGSISPYKMVIKVIGYALRHRHPQTRRGAFFFYSGFNPGRLDFAKVHYGGPFSTKDVENVKTFLQILCMLLCVGPVFILKITTSYFMYQHFVKHFVNQSLNEENCSLFWPFLGSGNQINLLTVIAFPIYIIVIFKVLKGIPRILSRLFLGLVMFNLYLISILCIEVIGHYKFMSNEGNTNKTLHCALSVINSTDNSLNVHWSSLLVPSLSLGLAMPILYATVFEFIAAQSPRAMTGLMVGTFYCVDGIFQLIGIANTIPFSLKKIWNHKELLNSTYILEESFKNLQKESSSSKISYTIYKACEFWYLVITIALGIIGIILFSIAAWRYKYRKVEEDRIPQAIIEDIVSRAIEQDIQNLLDVASVEVQNKRELRHNDAFRYRNYGLCD